MEMHIVFVNVEVYKHILLSGYKNIIILMYFSTEVLCTLSLHLVGNPFECRCIGL